MQTTTTTESAKPTEFRATEGGPEIASGSTLLVEAYAIVWVVILGFLFVSWRRQKALEQRIGDLERALASKPGAA